MNGSLESKLECEDFVNGLTGHDIIVLSESWTNELSDLSLKGYVCVSKHRRRRKRAKRDSGGLICYFKNEIWKGISKCEWDFEDGLLFKLCKTFFNLEHDLYLVAIYVKPASSSRDDLNGFDFLTDKLSEVYDYGEIVVMGDLNARTGTGKYGFFL